MQLPFTFRLVYHGLAAAIRGGLVLVVGWLILVPANESEATALGTTTANEYPSGLRSLRTARVIVAIAPERTYDVLAFALGPDIEPWMVRLMMIQVAEGNLLPPSASIPEPDPNRSDRAIEGPRFIQVD